MMTIKQLKMPATAQGKSLAFLLLLLAVTPILTALFQQPFYLDIATRIMVLAIAAVSLNLIVGYGGLVSFGHAAFLGIGAYSVGIPVHFGIYNGFIHLGFAIVASGVFALLTGMICLRTRGVYFIMITLAFAQMVYFTLVSLEEFGGDDGLVIGTRSQFLFDLEHSIILYYFIFSLLLFSVLIAYRLISARFGAVMIGAMHNEKRMQSLGFETYRYRLVCYVISGMLCGVAGFLLGNFTNYISPEMMDWTHSAELLLILILGGVGTVVGPIVGTFFFVLAEEWLSSITIYWQLIFGALLIALVLFGKGGISGLLSKCDR